MIKSKMIFFLSLCFAFFFSISVCFGQIVLPKSLMLKIRTSTNAIIPVADVTITVTKETKTATFTDGSDPQDIILYWTSSNPQASADPNNELDGNAEIKVNMFGEWAAGETVTIFIETATESVTKTVTLDSQGTQAHTATYGGTADTNLVFTTSACTQVLLTINKNIDGGTPTGAGAVCVNTPVPITAGTKTATHEFINWTGPAGTVFGNANLADTTVTMGTTALTITANYRKKPVITYQVKTNGTVGDAGGAIQKTADSLVITTETVATGGDGSEVKSVATAGYVFTGWADAGSGTATTYQLTNVTADKTLTANFYASYDVTFNSDDNGGVSTNSNCAEVQNQIVQAIQSGSNSQPVYACPTDPSAYEFDTWTGDDVPSGSAQANPLTITNVNGAKTVTATFKKLPVKLTMEVSPTGGGTTTPAVGVSERTEGEVVNLSTTINPGYRFINWTASNGTITNPDSPTEASVTMDLAKTVTANFEKIELTMAVNPTGGGTTTPTGTTGKNLNEEVDITATSAAGFRFDKWTVSAGSAVADPASATTKVTMDQAKTVTANFIRQYTLNASVSPQGAGTVAPESDIYDATSSVSITATEIGAYKFKGWTVNGAGAGAENPLNITMDGDKTVVANFVLADIDLTIEIDGACGENCGTTTPEPGTYPKTKDTLVEIEAIPEGGNHFVEWQGDGIVDPYEAKTQVLMDTAKTVTAVFEEDAENYNLTMLVDPADGGTTDPTGTNQQTAGDDVEITATAEEGYHFVKWIGAVADPYSATTTITMNATREVTAVFEANADNYDLTIKVSPANSGTTTPDYNTSPISQLAGAEVGITATANEGYRWVGWTGDVADQGNLETTVTMNSSKTVTANFELDTFTLNISSNDATKGTTNPAEATVFLRGSVVTISALPTEGNKFVNWTGDVVDANSATTTITMDADKTVVGNFALDVADYVLTVYVNPVGAGTVTPASGETYPANTVVNVNATPGAGYQFVSWTGGAVENPSSAATTITMTGNLAITANFQSTYIPPYIPPTTYYQLTITADPAGSGTFTPASGSWYVAGAPVAVSATASQGYQFVEWVGGVADPKAAQTSVTMNSNKSLTAKFAAVEMVELTMAVDPSGGGTTSPSVLNSPYSVAKGTNKAIKAIPADGYNFLHWLGEGIADKQLPETTVLMDASKTVTAVFELQHYPVQLTMAVSPAGSGTTDPSVEESPHDRTSGTQSIAAYPADGWKFANWNGEGIANINAQFTTVNLTNDRTITANFVKLYSLTMKVDPAGGGTTNPAIGTHQVGAGTQSISANPADGYQFKHWVGSGIANLNSALTTVTIDGNKEVTAVFEKKIVEPITLDFVVIKPASNGTFKTWKELLLSELPAPPSGVDYLYSMVELVMNVDDSGKPVSVTFTFKEPLPADAVWYVYDEKHGWYEYPKDKYEISEDRKTVIVEVMDNSYGDSDTIPGQVTITSGYGVKKSVPVDSGGGGSSSTCFIETASSNTNASGKTIVFTALIGLFMGFLLIRRK